MILKNYEKPVVLANDELAEGVYAASGSFAGAGAAFVSGVELVSAGNEYYKVNTYKVTITNSGSQDLMEWSASVSVTSGTASNAQVYNGWQASASLSGDKITISSGEGGMISANGSIDVEVVVEYSSESITVQ